IGTAASLTGCSTVQSVAGTGWIPQQYQVPGSWPVQVKGRVPIDPASPSLARDDKKCILCGQCLEVCKNVQSVFGYFELPVKDDFICINCGQCTLWCPTGAITEKDDIQKVKDAIADPNKVVVVQTAPGTRVGLGEEFGLPAGSWVQGQQVAALRKLGFDKVFDTLFTADLTIMEEGTELVQRINGNSDAPLPQFTSCCPGWIKFCEYYYPELIPNLSSAKSPQQMAGALFKTYFAKASNIKPEDIVSVSIMPCTAKKFECSRPEFNSSGKYWNNEEIRDVDVVLTTRELARMVKEAGIDLTQLPEEEYDKLLSEGSGAGLIFGNTGGVMEAAVRSAYFLLTGNKAPEMLFNLKPIRGLEGIKEGSLNIPGVGTLNIAVCHGLSNARQLAEAVKRGEAPYHFIEVMACPGGCISGGGQPRTSVPPQDHVREERTKSIYNKDASYVLRESHENKEVLDLYENFLEHPLSHTAHELLHTTYTSRADKLVAKKLF
ncbi:MAG: hydrogenase, partial [Clostridia bacterium]|nr:hydrogenase [Clostridia bacterium]